METVTMSWLSITRSKAEGEDCFITDRELPAHPTEAWTDNVRFLKMAVDVRISKLYAKSSGTSLQYISIQRMALTIT